MCIAILKPTGTKVLDTKIFDNCWERNKDGFWCMYQYTKARKKTVWIYKTMDKWQALEFFTKIQATKWVRDIAFHFRIATHWLTNIHNCHPFYAGQGLYMMHNWCLSLDDPFGIKSDSAMLADRLVSCEPLWQDDEEKMKSLAKYAIGSKLVFMWPTSTFIVNEKSWNKEDDIWFSNYSYIKYEAPKPAPYKSSYSHENGMTDDWYPDSQYKHKPLTKKERKALSRWNNKNRIQSSFPAPLPINEPPRGGNKILVLPEKVYTPTEYQTYKCSIQWLLSKDQRSDLNQLSEEESDYCWLEMLGYKPTLEEQLESIQSFHAFVLNLTKAPYEEQHV